jgi:hypothetical protein
MVFEMLALLYASIRLLSMFLVAPLRLSKDKLDLIFFVNSLLSGRAHHRAQFMFIDETERKRFHPRRFGPKMSTINVDPQITRKQVL